MISKASQPAIGLITWCVGLGIAALAVAVAGGLPRYVLPVIVLPIWAAGILIIVFRADAFGVGRFLLWLFASFLFAGLPLLILGWKLRVIPSSDDPKIAVVE